MSLVKSPCHRHVQGREARHPPPQTAKNRCRLNTIFDDEVYTAKSFRPTKVLEIIDGYWSLPEFVPTSFPSTDYPPTPPLLDQQLEEAEQRLLATAFVHNTVTYARPTRSNLVLEMFGDRCMTFLLSRMFLDDLEKHGEASKYYSLVPSGYDYLLKALSSGHLQSFFAMLYNFPARMTMAHEKPMQQQIFSQADMEGAFEAYLGVCMKYVPLEDLVRWFTSLVQPWVGPYLEAAIRLQREQIECRVQAGRDEGKGNKNKSRHRFDRRGATVKELGILPHVVYPTLLVTDHNGACSLKRRPSRYEISMSEHRDPETVVGSSGDPIQKSVPNKRSRFNHEPQSRPAHLLTSR